MSTVNENELRVVRLQIIDEVTGEPLDYVNVKTNAASVNFADGTFLEDAFKTLTAQVNRLQVSETKTRNTLIDHINNGGHVDDTKIANAIIGTQWDANTGVLTFIRYDGTEIEWDTAMEKIALDIEFDNTTNELVFTMVDGAETRVSVQKLVDIYGGVETDYTKVTVSETNEIQVDIKEGGILYANLSEEIKTYLTNSKNFIDTYAEKLEGIEEGANKYELPTATADVLGGIKIGDGLNIDEEGKVSVTNILYGESVDTATPATVFLQVESTGGSSTDEVPTMEAATSYITSEGNIINYDDASSSYEYINNTTDGTSETGLTADEVSAKFVAGLELIKLSDIEWYNDGTYEYAVTDSGDGFKYDAATGLFVEFVDTQTFIDLLNAGTLTEGQYEETV